MSGNFRVTPNSSLFDVKIVGSNEYGRFRKISAAFTQNMFKSDDWLISFPGYKRIITNNGGGTGRGLFHSVRSNVMVWVVGGNIYIVDINFNVTKVTVGDKLVTSYGEVFMAENLNSQVALVDGTNLYILTLTPPYTLTKQTDMSGPLSTGDLLPNYVRFHDTFFLIGNGNLTTSGAQWYAYSYLAATTVQVTTQLDLQTKPDFALAIVPIPGQANNVCVFGSTVCELQQNIGGIQNYRRNQSVNIDYGCASVATIATSDNFVVWLGVNEDNSPVIMTLSGQQATPISTNGIDWVLGRVQYPAQSTAYFFREIGHLFYVLTFYNAADNLSLMYDFTTQEFYNLTDQNENYHPALDMVYFGLKTYFIARATGHIYEISTDIPVIDENPIVNPAAQGYDPALVYIIPRMRVVPSMRKGDSARFIANSLVFTMAQGDDPNFTLLDQYANYPNLLITEDDFNPPDTPIVTESGQFMVAEQPNTSPPYINPGAEWAQFLPVQNINYQPRVDLTISNDNGNTWSSVVSRNLNPLGKRRNIITYEKLGLSNDLTLCFRFWSKWHIVVSNGELQVY